MSITKHCSTIRPLAVAIGLALIAPPAATIAIVRAQPAGDVTPAPPQAPQNAVRQSTYTAPVAADRAGLDRAARATRDPQAPGAPRGASPPAATKLRIGESAAGGARADSSPPSSAQYLSTALGSLAVVVGLFFVVAWAMRRALPATSQRLPRDVVEVLGYVTLAPRQQARLVRLGHKLLLVSVTPSGSETLSEVTEPAEVERLVTLCGGATAGAGSTTGTAATFRDLMQHLRQRSTAGAASAKPPATAAPRNSTRDAGGEVSRG